MKYKIGDKVTIERVSSFHSFQPNEVVTITEIDTSENEDEIPYYGTNENGEGQWMLKTDIE